ncbi:hypothetical protein DEJ30_11985 [Curtobacterium sp. MCPF17_003]|uniref:hypothetical protein n=1 Tax=Curtobacterium sp. MCPF17_003 TaxID=2175637 RepID=UPI000D9F7975|nr:hypothetical protein [Curtobacterium sp. MCPF17_003]PYY63626.1 hypothetical protein DEJ30_11985 [Curtobacterium sp. MCPF17_003]
MKLAGATIRVTPEMVAAAQWDRDHLVRRGTEDYDRVLDIVRHKTYVLDEHARRINGRYIKVAYMALAEDGGPIIDGDTVRVKWKRVRIPRTHPWRGRRS